MPWTFLLLALGLAVQAAFLLSLSFRARTPALAAWPALAAAFGVMAWAAYRRDPVLLFGQMAAGALYARHLWQARR